MTIEVKVPAAGESITSANVARWHRKNGESVKAGDNLVTLETDKVSNELEAEADGVLQIVVGEGEEVAIGTVIAKIATDGAASSTPKPQAASTPAPSTAEKLKPAPAASSSGGAVELKVPAAGESITSANVASWRRKDGDIVSEGEVLVTRFRPSQLHQGWRDVLHGGVQATVFDDLMSNCMFRIHNLSVVTAELTTRFRSPVPLDRELEFRAWRSGGRSPLWELSAECRIQGETGGRPLSSAKGRFMETPTHGR